MADSNQKNIISQMKQTKKHIENLKKIIDEKYFNIRNIRLEKARARDKDGNIIKRQQLLYQDHIDDLERDVNQDIQEANRAMSLLKKLELDLLDPLTRYHLALDDIPKKPAPKPNPKPSTEWVEEDMDDDWADRVPKKGGAGSVPHIIMLNERLVQLISHRNTLHAELVRSIEEFDSIRNRFVNAQLRGRNIDPNTARQMDARLQELDDFNERRQEQLNDLQDEIESIAREIRELEQRGGAGKKNKKVQFSKEQTTKMKIYSVSFPINTEYDTSAKRLKFIKNELNIVPIKKQHTTKNFYKYRIIEPEKGIKYKTKKLNNGINLTLGK